MTLAGLIPAADVRADLGTVLFGGRSSPRAASAPKPIPLVNVDEEHAIFLDRARGLAGQKDYLPAIEILQNLIDKAGDELVSDGGDGRRFISLAAKAQSVIAGFGPEGLSQYRRMYDPQFGKLYDDAIAAGDIPGLRQVAWRGQSSTHGPRAMDTLGAICCDAGRFVEAARYWKQAMDILSPDGNGDGGPQTRPAEATGEPAAAIAMLLTKHAAACHFGGDAAGADLAAKTLAERYPGARGTVAGQERDLGEYLRELRSSPVPPAPAAAVTLTDWPGLGGRAPLAVMSECNVVPAASWRDPPYKDDGAADVLVAEQERTVIKPNRRSGTTYKAAVKGGLVEIRAGNDGSYPPGGNAAWLCLIEPVVAGETVLYRRDDAVVACDLVTGQRKASSVALPMVRPATVTSDRYGGEYYSPTGTITDSGRYALTIGDGLVYTVARFRPSAIENYRRPDGPAPAPDTSDLVALSVNGQLRMVWRKDSQNGEDDVLRNCRFLCAPAYDNGRVYALAVHVEKYYLVCLDARTGALVWRSMLCQAGSGERSPYPGMNTRRACPPCVADGRVFVATNTGVVTAHDAMTGKVVWAYQYDNPDSRGYNPASGVYPPNPVIAAGDRVAVLPADSEKMLILTAQDGRLLGQSDRQEMCFLSAIDANRAAISGRWRQASGTSLRVVSLADGRTVRDFNRDALAGRPAVTSRAIYSSARGKLVRVDLEDYTYTAQELAGGATEGLLGNLVLADDTMVAANAAGVSAYMSYQQGEQRLTRRLDAAPADRRPDILLARGQFAFQAGRFDQALADCLAAVDPNAGQVNDSLAQRAGQMVFRAYIALGNNAPDGEKMLDMFAKAAALAASDQDKAQMRVRQFMARRLWAGQLEGQAAQRESAGDLDASKALRERKGAQLAQAVGDAQQMAEDAGSVELVPVDVGPSVKDSLVPPRGDQRLLARKLAQDFIRDVLREYGDEPYTRFNDMARERLERSRHLQDVESMAEIARRWPNSVWAQNADFLAAEMMYRKAALEKGQGADVLWDQTMELLWPLVASGGDSSMRLSACAALAAINARRGWPAAAEYAADRARDIARGDTEAVVAFADLQGSLDDVLAGVNRGPAAAAKPPRLPSEVNPPLAPIFSIADKAEILRDQDYQPIRLDERILMAHGDRVMLVDTRASSAESAVSWQTVAGAAPAAAGPGEPGRAVVGMVRINGRPVVSTPAPAANRIAGLSRDQTIIAIADKRQVRGFDRKTAKLRWATPMTKMGVNNLYYMAIGDGVLAAMDNSGRTTCIDLSDGNTVWTGVQAVPDVVRGIQVSPAAALEWTLRIRYGILLVRNARDGGSLTRLDITRGMPVIAKSGQSVDGQFTPGGLIVTVSEGTMSVFDPTQLEKPVHTASTDATRILTVNQDVAVLGQEYGNRLRIARVNVKDSRPSEIEVGSSEASEMVPVHACIDGNSIYVLCSELGSMRGQACDTQLQKFGATGGKRLWSCPVESVVQGFSPMTVGSRHIAIAAGGGDGPCIYLIDKASGKVAQKLPMTRPAAGRKPGLQTGTGPVVMTRGRLCVETDEGVTVYGGQ